MSSNTEENIRRIIKEWQPDAKVSTIVALTPDASLRRYFRVSLTGDERGFGTILAMVFDSIAPPEVGGADDLNSDEAYVRLSEMFWRRGMPIPEMYWRQEVPPVLLVEDLGDLLLANMTDDGAKDRFSERGIDELYRSAVDEIIRLQSMPIEKGFFAFERGFTKSLFVSEMNEFRDFVLGVKGLDDSQNLIVERVFDELAEVLMNQEYVLSHRDFHPGNLMVDNGGIRIIDFQDALNAPKTYDLVSLLNDRDTDSALGNNRYEMLRNYFRERSRYGENFDIDYSQVLLQRDLKVAGRFSKLVKERGLITYSRWIPGTLRRIDETLKKLSDHFGTTSVYTELLSVLSKVGVS